MKKLLSLTLALAMLLGLTLPAAAAEETSDAALARVTQTVKETLELDTEDYEEFWGSRYEDGLTGIWSLSWSGADGDLSIEALDDGTVLSYRLSQTYDSYNTFPTFPQGDADSAAQAARNFLDKVLGENEQVELEEPSGLDSLNSDSYRFSGTILLNGLPSPLSYSMTVRAADSQVIRFSRDVGANTFLGEVPSAQAAVGAEAAAAALTGELKLRLEYVLDEDGTSAVLRYLPENTHTYYVDAVTGEKLDLTELESQMGGMSGGAGDSSANESAPEEDSGSGLTQAEQEGIAKLEGVQSSEELDRGLRAVSAYGLTDYALSSASYTLVEAQEEGEEDQVLCTLSYGKAGEKRSTRILTVDARTGAVQTVSTYAAWLEEGETAALSREETQARAEEFLAEFCGARWETLTRSESEDSSEENRPYDTYTYVRESSGIPFPEHYYTVAIDRRDGSVYRLRFVYDEDVTFASPAGIVDEAAALAAWAGTYETTLAYRLVPRALDSSDEQEARLLALGLTHFYGLRLTYGLEREGYCRGIDAATGTPLWQETSTRALTYTDLEGTWVQADAEKLASFGVGYDGGTFGYRKSLTQWDLVAMLASLEGYCIDPENAEEWTRDAAYAAAYSMGALERGERDEDRVITRGELVTCLLDCAGYRAVARLEGIYTCTYRDAASIPADELGYAALAQGLGMVQGNYDGARVATRGELAVMLCRLLER